MSATALKAGIGLTIRPQEAELSRALATPYLCGSQGGLRRRLRSGSAASAAHRGAGFYKDLRNPGRRKPAARLHERGLGRVYGGELLIRQPPWHNLLGLSPATPCRSSGGTRRRRHYYLFRFRSDPVYPHLGRKLQAAVGSHGRAALPLRHPAAPPPESSAACATCSTSPMARCSVRRPTCGCRISTSWICASIRDLRLQPLEARPVYRGKMSINRKMPRP